MMLCTMHGQTERIYDSVMSRMSLVRVYFLALLEGSIGLYISLFYFQGWRSKAISFKHLCRAGFFIAFPPFSDQMKKCETQSARPTRSSMNDSASISERLKLL